MKDCYEDTKLVIVETIPRDLDLLYSVSTYDFWMKLISETKESLYIASFYWSLCDEDSKKDETSNNGKMVLKELIKLTSRACLKIVVNKSNQPSEDLLLLSSYGAQVIYVDIKNIFGGVLHTKFLISDELNAYIGSANMDWRSLSQVKELGIGIYNSSCLVMDLIKIFNEYCYIGYTNVPCFWTNNYKLCYNIDNPLSLINNNYKVFIASSPPSLSKNNGTDDLYSLLSAIKNAEKFIYISVMNYIPVIYQNNKTLFWPDVDIELRKAAIDKRISIKLLVSFWDHTPLIMKGFLKSLKDINYKNINIEVRFFIIPKNQLNIPYTRVNHTKYMVTDKVAYVGTSNWLGNYFNDTCGVSLNIIDFNELAIRSKLENIFIRDWNSVYSFPISYVTPKDNNEKVPIKQDRDFLDYKL
ncbi:phospholipase-D-like protein [Goatpox virus]|uniref:Phospholipase-D-like protein n=1 Tax=Goatpox virus TaxID=186805 RepID=A0A5C0PSQ0_9POXV|nr:phospholipase-D-like protein [Goatpox virus]QEJ79444.1 phospholipase-D-like protein [Goatpox virus]QEJ79594.1 phospholipase-D-like protein [Goatpox virus]